MCGRLRECVWHIVLQLKWFASFANCLQLTIDESMQSVLRSPDASHSSSHFGTLRIEWSLEQVKLANIQHLTMINWVCVQHSPAVTHAFWPYAEYSCWCEMTQSPLKGYLVCSHNAIESINVACLQFFFCTCCHRWRLFRWSAQKLLPVMECRKLISCKSYFDLKILRC